MKKYLTLIWLLILILIISGGLKLSDIGTQMSIIGSFFIVGIGTILSIVYTTIKLNKSIKENNTSNKKMSISGLVLSIIILVLHLIFFGMTVSTDDEQFLILSILFGLIGLSFIIILTITSTILEKNNYIPIKYLWIGNLFLWMIYLSVRYTGLFTMRHSLGTLNLILLSFSVLLIYYSYKVKSIDMDPSNNLTFMKKSTSIYLSWFTFSGMMYLFLYNFFIVGILRFW